MDPTPGGPGVGCYFFEKGKHIVLCAFFVFDYVLDSVAGFLADGGGIGGRYLFEPRHAFAGKDFDFQPMVEFGFFRPKASHFRA